MKILVADQEVQHRVKLVEFITHLGYIVVEAIDSREVIKKCQHKCPDLIVLDHMLSGVSAIDLSKQIRRLGGNATWNPIVVMGDQFTDEEKVALLESGVDDLITKPVQEINIKFKINTAKRQASLKDDVFSVAHDLVLANRALESAASLDVLTGIMDMNKFYLELEKLWFLAKKTHNCLSLILLDLDNFREFNLRYTAEQGDLTIQLIANHLKQQVGQLKIAQLARTTGVTFGVLLLGSDQDAAVKIAEKLRTSILDLKIPHVGSSNNKYLTASLGVSTTDEISFKQSIDLLESADFALYQAKHAGRNRVFFEMANVC